MPDWLTILLALTPLWIILAAPIVWPSMLKLGSLNTQGNFLFLDLATLRSAFPLISIMLTAKVLLGVRVDAQEIIAALIMAALLSVFVALYVHIIWRRTIRPSPDPRSASAP